ncbi:MAG TPA: pantetheine-phosphate adenylyltransferase [Bacteroidia bacterium]|nr:pantetheine-phosphate adenylyltransferase [Bacteroidia bacterium]HNT79790.1 pantetheine-phosphate adenylyltransferase [Bacteroidia bacterium]
MKRACFPGSFDPLTNGHIYIVQQGLKIFDEVIISLGSNSSKKYMFSEQDRLNWLRKCFSNEPRVKVMQYDSLTVEFCRQIKASHILRGLRSSADFEFEKAIAHMNNKIAPEIESVFILANPEHSMISSSIIRELIRNKADVTSLIPSCVEI